MAFFTLDELREARQALDERKQVERAKQQLMRQQGFSEGEAYGWLRQAAMNQGLRLEEVAQRLGGERAIVHVCDVSKEAEWLAARGLGWPLKQVLRLLSRGIRSKARQKAVTYTFVFMRAEGTTHHALPRTVARIEYFDDLGAGADSEPLLNTSVSGELQPLNTRSLRRALWSYPAMTFGVMARIHWQAVRLWIKRAPFFRQPPAPGDFVTAASLPASPVNAEHSHP